MKWLQFSGLLLCAYIVLGNGSCGNTPDQDRYYSKDVCGPAAPFYWTASEAGRPYAINKCNKDATECIQYKSGNYSSPILLECLSDTTMFYNAEQYN